MSVRMQPTYTGDLTDEQIALAVAELQAHGFPNMTRELFLANKDNLNTLHTTPICFFDSSKTRVTVPKLNKE